MPVKINPFDVGNPMSLKDAAVVASVVALVTWILTFFADLTIGEIRADAAAVCLEAVRTYVVSWAGSFISLAGLEQYVKRKEASEQP